MPESLIMEPGERPGRGDADRRMMRAFRSVSENDFDPHTLEQHRRRVLDPTQR